MIKKTLMVVAFSVSSLGAAFAGGILTNTNQSARFARLFALEAMTNAADAAYYNPAGTIKLSEGFHFTFSNQSAFQERHINTTFPSLNGGNPKLYKGTASAPIVPSLQGVYKKGKWALSGSIAIVGGGGKATFEDGLPMFEVPVSQIPPALTGFAAGAGIPLTSDKYSFDTYLSGTNYIFGGQLGGAYEINKMFSVYAGFRLNVVHNKYEGYLSNIKINPKSDALPQLGNGDMVNASAYFSQLAQMQHPAITDEVKGLLNGYAAMTQDKEIDSKQSGWGVAPILGVNFSYAGLNIGAKYEFKTNLNVENKTKLSKDAGLDSFKDGVNTAHDVPALFAIGASYDIIEPLTVSFGYHHFFDKQAGMAGDKQKALTGGTNEYLFGAEWRINKLFLISGGGQVTKYGLADNFQSDLSFYVNSYSLGFGGAVNVAKNVQINVGYFFTDYSDYDKAEAVSGSSVPVNKNYTRKNKVFTAGVDFSF